MLPSELAIEWCRKQTYTLSTISGEMLHRRGQCCPVCEPVKDVIVRGEVNLLAALEAGVRTGTGIFPGWVYEARDAIRHQNENPPQWLPDLLKALGWQTGTIHDALNAVYRLVAADKERHPS